MRIKMAETEIQDVCRYGCEISKSDLLIINSCISGLLFYRYKHSVIRPFSCSSPLHMTNIHPPPLLAKFIFMNDLSAPLNFQGNT